MLKISSSKDYKKILMQFINNYDFNNPINLFIFGPPGIGKTKILESLNKDKYVLNLRLSTIQPEDILGIPTANGWLIPNNITRLNKESNSILFLDELNMAKEYMLSAVFNLIDRTEMINNFKLENTIVIAAGNKPEDNIYAKHLALPLRNRFVYIEYEPEQIDDFISYLQNKNDDVVYDRYDDLDKKANEANLTIRDIITVYLYDNKHMVHYKYIKEINDNISELYTFPTPRSYEYAIKLNENYKFSIKDSLYMAVGNYTAMKIIDYANMLLEFKDIDKHIEKGKIELPRKKDGEIDIIKSTYYITYLAIKLSKNNSRNTKLKIFKSVLMNTPEELISLYTNLYDKLANDKYEIMFELYNNALNQNEKDLIDKFARLRQMVD